MYRALQVLNELETAGTFAKWALGGAMGLTYYLEATETDDVDVLVLIPQKQGQLLVGLEPLHSELKNRGYEFRDEHVIIENVPVQFIDVTPGSLEAEALEEAVESEFYGTRLRVARLEHLLSVAIRLQRAKDKIRLSKAFTETPNKVDFVRLEDILSRYGLLARYREFRRAYG